MLTRLANISGLSIFFHSMQSVFIELRQTSRNYRMRQKGLKCAGCFSKTSGGIRLDLGCGSSKRPGFIGVDLNRAADLQWDIGWGLPFDDNSIFEIRSDHFFEHLELPKVVEVFSECRRVLIPGGTLDFSVPHLDPYVDAYLRRDYKLLSERITDIPVGQEDLYGTCFDLICWLLHRAGDHRSMFDRESIIAKLTIAGFTKTKIRTFDRNRDLNWRFSSIYVTAVK